MKVLEGDLIEEPQDNSYSFTTEILEIGNLPRDGEVIEANGKFLRVIQAIPGKRSKSSPPIPVMMSLCRDGYTRETAEEHNKAIRSRFYTDFSVTVLTYGGGQYYILPYRAAKHLRVGDKVLINDNHREISWVEKGIGPDGEPIICVKVVGSYSDAKYSETYKQFVFLARDQEGRQYQIGDLDKAVTRAL
ncbi:MAG: hypothetical protein MJA83_16700 [Gammaproteobacteria bacterium]|nr:hypothetical protein [Gammaproteobacteria bacterium]